MRKQASTVEEARNQLKHRYKRGRKRERRVTEEAALTAVDRAAKRKIACYLKAQDFSYHYIGDALGLGVNVIKKWFQEPEMQAEYQVILDDITGAAVKLLKSYAIEFIEMLAEIARTTPDDKIALQAIVEGLDRMGISKVNKSESLVKDVQEVEITDKTGFLHSVESAPPEVQAQIAANLEQAFALAAEHTDEDVTHA